MFNKLINNDSADKGQATGTMTVEELENYIIAEFNADLINQRPATVADLLKYYSENTYYIYQYLKLVTDKQLDFASNELRAMLGHIAEYRINHDGTKNDLEKSYGHFRRMTLDILKVICDVFDESLLSNLKKLYKTDFRNINKDYLKEYSEQYFKAKNYYVQAQSDERTGADSNKHNIISKYYLAAVSYIRLKQYKDRNKKAQRSVLISHCIGCGLVVIGVLGFISDVFAVYTQYFQP